MSLKKERFIKGIILAPDTIALDGLEGEIKVDSSTGKIQVTLKDGANPSAAREIITSSQTQTLTNKTLDVDNNIVSNIETDNLKAGVLNVSTSLTGASDTQVPSALAAKTYIDTANTAQQNIIDDLVTLSGVASGAENLGTFTGTTIPDNSTNKQALQALETELETKAESSDLTTHTGASSDVHGVGVGNSVVGTGTSQALTNKTIDADLNTISNIEDADIKVGAAISRAKLASGTANRVVVNNGTGVQTDAAAITAARALISDANGIPTHSAVTSTELGYSSGVTSGIQTQLDAKVDEVGGTFTSGSVITPIRSDVKQDTKANLTTYALTAANGQLVFATDTKEMFQVVDTALKAVGGGGGVSDVDSLLIQPFDTAALTDFTQTGLELIETNPLDGTRSARLIHQAGSTRSFKQIVSVPPKFRGVNMTASLTIRSSASQGNVTIAFRDETNSIDYLSQQLQTNSQAIASLVTNATTLVSGFSNSNINTLRVGMSVTGSGIPTGTTIASINTTALTITLSQAATASATVSLRFSDLPRTLQLGFTIPANCASYSYTISALQESGSPETYIDDVVLKNYWLGMSNQGQSTVAISVPTVTEWQSYTPTFTGFGTVSSTGMEWRQVGSNIELRGKFTSGTSTAVEARMSLPNGYTSAAIPSIQAVGSFAFSSGTATAVPYILIEPSINYVTFGYNVTTTAGLTKQNGSSLLGSGTSLSLFASIPIANLSATTTASVTTTDLVPAKAVFGNTSLDIPNMTAWQGYTPTFQGFGTPSAVEFEWRQVGEDVEVRGKFTSGTSTAVEARVGLPAGLTSAGTGLIPSISNIGYGVISASSAAQYVPLIEASVSYLTFGIQSNVTNGITKSTASGFLTSGQTYSFFAKVPCAGLSATSTKTIALTQSGLVQSADSMIRLNTVSGYGSTATAIPRFTTIVQSLGSDITYVDSATNGASFTVNTAGIYSMSVSFDYAAGDGGVGVSLNSNQLTTAIGSITDSARLAFSEGAATTSGNNKTITAACSVYLNAGDVIRPHGTGSAINANGQSLFTIARQGSLKQLAVSSDQKITIPTSELRFEGASARGSTDTAVVKFDTQAKIRGDAFSVVNNATNGTVITMLKAGRLFATANVYYLSASGNGELCLTKNSSVLTTNPAGTEVFGYHYNASSAGNGVRTVNGMIDVSIGDIIRVQSNITPSANASYSQFSLAFQEQDIAVSVTNTLPQFSESDSSVRVDTANGYGSTGTMIRRFSNIRDNIGTDIEYVDSAVNGASFTVKSSGVYSVTYADTPTVDTYIGISKNASSLSTVISTLVNTNPSEVLTLTGYITGATAESVSWTGYLQAGDIIRPHTASATTTASPNRASFTISKVGKPNVTGVNVTPFINVPQPEVEYIRATGHSAFVGANSVPSSFVANTNKGIVRFDSSTGRFTALKTCIVNLSASNVQGSAGSDTDILLNGNSVSRTDNAAASTGSALSWSGQLVTGDWLAVAPQFAPSVQNISLTAEAQSDQILTPIESFSTDTASLTYAPSSSYTLATLSNAPVGTFITFTYAASTNTITQTTTAPTQTAASMNTNGIQIFTRVYASASTAASPSRVALQIGKGLKGVSIAGFQTTGKTLNLSLDFWVASANAVQKGLVYKEYNESTGILILDAGQCIGTGVTTNQLEAIDGSGGVTSGYLVINASKSPALAGIPLLQPRIATISDVKAANTAGGTATSGAYQTRTLNTIDDPTGIVTSLASNQITLPKGEYYIEALAPAYCDSSVANAVGIHKAKLRNITDSTDAIIGTPERLVAPAGASTSNTSRVYGKIILTSAKTFELQHRVGTTFATFGFGIAANYGDVEVYSIIRITKIKD